jgi:hypothetical protein
MLGFVLTRHVNSEITNEYWIECIRQIRLYYPKNIIMIVDDNSNYKFVNPKDLNLNNCFFIESEYKSRGEILAYYYFHKYKLFDKAVIIHDSIFIQKYIDFDSIKNVQFFWDFVHDYDEPEKEKKLIYPLNNNTTLLQFYDQKHLWKGCFGIMTVIEYSFLNRIVEKYNFFILLNHIFGREQRYMLERVFAAICTYENNDLIKNPSLYKNIHEFSGYSYICRWGYSFAQYMDDKKNNVINKEIIKVWSGR